MNYSICFNFNFKIWYWTAWLVLLIMATSPHQLTRKATAVRWCVQKGLADPKRVAAASNEDSSCTSIIIINHHYIGLMLLNYDLDWRIWRSDYQGYLWLELWWLPECHVFGQGHPKRFPVGELTQTNHTLKGMVWTLGKRYQMISEYVRDICNKLM